MWSSIPLEQAVEAFLSGGTPDTKNDLYWTGDIPWITGADFSEGNVVLGRRFINEKALQESATNIVPQGSILLVTRTGVGKMALAPEDVAISQDITGIVLKKGFHAGFVLGSIRSQLSFLLANQRGATIKGVTREDVKRLALPFVAFSEQARIAGVLDKVASLRKQLSEASQKLDQIQLVLLHRAFSGDLTARWREAHMKELLRELEIQARYLKGDTK